MKEKIKKYLIFIIIFVLLFNLNMSVLAAQQPQIPVIEQIKTQYSYGNFVKGKSEKNTEILMYINGQYYQTIQIKKCNNFLCRFELNDLELKPGNYKVFFIAKDKTSLVLSAPTKEYNFIVKNIPAPTLVKIVKGNILTGLTISGTKVKVFVDDKYDGETDILYHNSGTANFAYRIKDNTPGRHLIKVKAVNKLKKESDFSKGIEFFVDYPYPAPILFEELTKKENKEKVLIVGVVKSNSYVQLFLDNKLFQESDLLTDSSGTANFAFRVSGLTEGKHLVYTVAINKDKTKISSKSNVVAFLIKKKVVPKISQKAAQETNKAALKSNKIVVKGTEFEQTSSDKEGLEKKENLKSDDNDNVVIPSIDNKNNKKTGGLINEKKQNQNTLNIIIFVLFLVIIITWIFWVNRELIKEKNKK